MPRKERETGGGTVLAGSNGDDTLDGLEGSYILKGGNGNDTYIVDADDSIDERNNGGTDHVVAHVDWALGANLENLTLAGTADLSGTGNAAANTVTGNAGANALAGGDGDDSLYGGGGDDRLHGGAGADLLDGGDGTDTAVFAGLLADYSFAWSGSDLRVTDAQGETDTLRRIEYLAFDDTVIAVPEPGTPVTAASETPQAADDRANVAEDGAVVIDVLGNDSGQGLTVTSATGASLGSVALNADGSLTYTPDPDAHGADSFTYTVADDQGRTSSASVAVEIASVNDAPTAANDSYSALAGETFASPGSVLANDTDVDGDPLTVSAHETTSAAGGSVEMAADGSFTYLPPAGFIGTDSFAYTVTEGQGGEATATVTIAVEDPATDPGAPPYYVDSLIYSDDWRRMNWPEELGSAVTVTYAFLSEVPDYYDWWTLDPASFEPFTAEQQLATRQVLAAIAGFTGISFVEVAPAEAGMTFGMIDAGGTGGVGYKPFGDGVGSYESDVWLDVSFGDAAVMPGSTGYGALVHEIGHALGLRHPDLPDGEETQQFSVMAAYPYPTIGGAPDEYRLFDVAALQHLYGANLAHAAGDNIYDAAMLLDQTAVIWDAGGRDAIDLSAAPQAVSIDLGEGAFSTAHATGAQNIAIAFGTLIEDAVGSPHNDQLTGNDAANRLDGGAGDDLLTGLGGADSFVFTEDWGNDTITDFVRGEDMLDLRVAGPSFADLHIVSSGGDTQVSYRGDSILLQGVDTVDESDFVFA